MSAPDSKAEPSAMRSHILGLEGPILVLGASGFVGANLLCTLLRYREDVHGTASRLPAWRLESLPPESVHVLDLLLESSLDSLLEKVRPRTVFNCMAFGAYSFERNEKLIYETNFVFITRLLPRLVKSGVHRYIHAGSSSEYGLNCEAPLEDAPLLPNSHYSVSKIAASAFISYQGRVLGFPCANLRLYSVYGPLEDSSRLMPVLVKKAVEGKLPDFVSPETSRDFIYVDDAVDAFIQAASSLKPEDYGRSFNIGSGRRSTMRDVAVAATSVFNLDCQPSFGQTGRDWDTENWYANPALAFDAFGWRAATTLEDGLRKTADWYQSLPDRQAYESSSKKYLLDTRNSITAVIACYRDNQAIPIMYSRLKQVFTKLGVDHEIIFVNDCSPDDSEEIIRKLTADDPRVVGISHSRNFGSQAAFMSGLKIATKNACVLLDGDLQDPPELIESFVAEWRKGFDVVYGRRVKREAPILMQIAYKAFYRVFNYFSYIPVPHDAGDFALLDRRVVESIVRFEERDLFLRGVRAFAGFRQCGVDYIRPERMFGVSTNNLLKNFGWAKKGILSFSNTPLQIISAFGLALFGLTCVLAVCQLLLRLLRPDLIAPGVTTLLLAVMFFGSLGVLSTAVVGEYIAKIFEEVKRRPLFIRRGIIKGGVVRDALPDGRLRE